MNTMMMTIKCRKALLGSLLLLPVLIFILLFHRGGLGSRDGRQPELQTFQLGDGWGYRIVVNDKVLINQPTIPAIDTVRPFPSEISAYTVGSLVLDRMNKNLDFSVSIEDIENSLSD